MSTIDLRSDTITKPSTAMREAMAQAVVGDDVYGEDPTVNKLEHLGATLLGKDAALFVPSGTMANQIAIRCHTSPGDDVLAGASAHTWLYESGAAAAISGVQFTILDGNGHFTAEQVHNAYRDGKNHHHSPTRLVTVENTHNMAGGRVWNGDVLKEVLAAANTLGLATHLDGARLWNAAAAAQKPAAELAKGFDSVSVCLSKGLGAPVGSLLAGTKIFIENARRFRKMFGGGMRQAGIIAQGGIFAIENNRERLLEDHQNSRLLAEKLSASPWFDVSPETVETNIVMVDISHNANIEAAALVKHSASKGVLFAAIKKHRFRLVTHLDVNTAACVRAAEIIMQEIERLAAEN